MDQQKVLITILGMMVVTYLPRFLPAWLLSSRQLPPRLTKWLRFVPPAVIAAMLLPWLFVSHGEVMLRGNTGLLVAFPTLLFAVTTRNFFGTVAAGVMLVAVARYLGI